MKKWFSITKHSTFANYRKIFIGVIFTALLSGLENFIISSRGREGIDLQLVIVMVLSFVALRKVQSEWVLKLIVSV